MKGFTEATAETAHVDALNAIKLDLGKWWKDNANTPAISKRKDKKDIEKLINTAIDALHRAADTMYDIN
jgi:hypothetical protein